MNLESRLDKLEQAIGAGEAPQFHIIRICREDGPGQLEGLDSGPTEQQKQAKLAELMARNPGQRAYFAVWLGSEGWWRS